MKDAGLLGVSIFIAGESPLWSRIGPLAGTTHVTTPAETASDTGARIYGLGTAAMRYGLALVFLWFGAMKFTSYQATGIAPFIAYSPLVGWWHALLGISICCSAQR